MKKIMLLLFFLLSGISFGQHPGPGECTLKPDNKAWIWRFKEADNRTDKIDLVVNKILADTDYFEENPEIANLDDRSVFGKIPCSSECSIRFSLVYRKNKGLTLDLKRNPELEDLILEFTSENIIRIDLNESQEKDIYKHVAPKRSGIVLYTEDNNLKKKIRKAIRNIRKS